MPFVSLLASNWRLFVLIAALGAGWYAHTVWDGYRADKTENKEVASLGKGEANIIDFNAKLDKETSNVKDGCITHPIPANVLLLLK